MNTEGIIPRFFTLTSLILNSDLVMAASPINEPISIISGKILSDHPVSASNSQIKKFKADHDSVQFYKNIIIWYIELYEKFPDEYL